MRASVLHVAIASALLTSLSQRFGTAIWVLATPSPAGSDPDGWPTERNPACFPFYYGKSRPKSAAIFRLTKASRLGAGWEHVDFTFKAHMPLRSKSSTQARWVYGYVTCDFPSPGSVQAVLLKLTPEHFVQMLQNGVILMDDSFQRRRDAVRH